MSSPEVPIIESRSHQMFPTLAPDEIERLRRFGALEVFEAGSHLASTGEVSRGFFVLLEGEVEITQRDARAPARLLVVHGPGSFLGELAQLAGRPALVDGVARSRVEVLVIPPSELRRLFVEEADLGEKIMRALILRRVGLLETGGGGPVIIGRAENPDVLRLEGFLSRNGHPYQHLDPDTDDGAKALLERLHPQPDELPIVICPDGSVLRNPTVAALARCIGHAGAARSERRLRRGDRRSRSCRTRRPQCTPRPKDSRFSCSTAAPLADRRAHPRGSRTTSAFPPASPVWR